MSHTAGTAARPRQDGPLGRNVAPTSTPLISAIGSKRDVGMVLQPHQHAAPKALPSIKAPTAPQPQIQKFGRLLDRASDCIAVGGHRGNGQNLINDCGNMVPDTRENTLASFHRAVANGATFVEFDVQVTSDNVPVIWHDNLVVTGDPLAPTFRMIRDMTLAEFKGLSSSEGFPAAQPLLRRFHRQDGTLMSEYTVWRVVDDAELPTLADLFNNLPATVAFDIELKLTTPDDQLYTTPAEVTRMTSAVMATVQLFATQGRTILFTSFCPCTCKHLKLSQSAYPVMFLSDIGACWHINPQRTGLLSAIEFAREAGLNGLVVETAELKSQQHMVEVVRDQGLQLLTFGIDNNDPDWVRKQYFLGVHAAIVDELPRIGSFAWASATSA